jgi:predicted MPP superfamily phosphohydrolase
MNKIAMPNSSKRKKRRRLLKITAFIFAATVIYGALIPPRRVSVTNHTVQISNLPESMDGLRVVQISDLHVSPLFKKGSVRKIVKMTNALNPDLVLLTGDFVNYHSMKYLPDGAKELRKLKSRFGIYACLGNHDYWEGADDVRRILDRNGVTVLMNEHIKVGDGLYLAAIDDLMSGKPDLKKALNGLPDQSPVILMSHNPTILPQVANYDLLVVSGHTHGGQIALPFLGPRKTFGLPGINDFTKLYESAGVKARHGRMDTVSTYLYPEGWYNKGKAKMYVCRGVGFGLTIPIRLNCPPEIACFRISSGKNDQPHQQ